MRADFKEPDLALFGLKFGFIAINRLFSAVISHWTYAGLFFGLFRSRKLGLLQSCKENNYLLVGFVQCRTEEVVRGSQKNRNVV